jgi:2-phospho-L-lactate/phosphoenolpyruvate guanylyltransferase
MLPRVLAIVPVRGRHGKRRLDGLLEPAQRARLVEAMLADVLAACRASRSVARTLVVTPDPALAAGESDVLEDRGEGHAAAVTAALADERAGGGALVVMADCPLATPDALDRLAAAARPLALAPAEDGGLNAVAFRGPPSFEPAFGVPGAAEETLARARAAGLRAAVLDEPALAFDVDRPADIRRLRENGGRSTRAYRVLEAIFG